MLEARVLRHHLVLGSVPGGDRDQNGRRAAVGIAKNPRDVVAGYPGQADVEQDDVATEVALSRSSSAMRTRSRLVAARSAGVADVRPAACGACVMREIVGGTI